MMKPMSDERFEHIQRVRELISKSPWIIGYPRWGFGVFTKESGTTVARLDNTVGEHCQESDNGAFIADAPDFVDELVTEVKRLRVAEARLRVKLIIK